MGGGALWSVEIATRPTHPSTHPAPRARRHFHTHIHIRSSRTHSSNPILLTNIPHHLPPPPPRLVCAVLPPPSLPPSPHLVCAPPHARPPLTPVLSPRLATFDARAFRSFYPAGPWAFHIQHSPPPQKSNPSRTERSLYFGRATQQIEPALAPHTHCPLSRPLFLALGAQLHLSLSLCLCPRGVFIRLSLRLSLSFHPLLPSPPLLPRAFLALRRRSRAYAATRAHIPPTATVCAHLCLRGSCACLCVCRRAAVFFAAPPCVLDNPVLPPSLLPPTRRSLSLARMHAAVVPTAAARALHDAP